MLNYEQIPWFDDAGVGDVGVGDVGVAGLDELDKM
jgi:hypothetical protein